MKDRTRSIVLVCAAVLLLLGGHGSASASRIEDSAVRDRLASLERTLAEGEALAEVEQGARAVFDAVTAYGRPSDSDHLVDAYWLAELASHLQALNRETRRTLAAYLVEHESLSKALVFAMSRHDRPEAVYAVLERLRRKDPDRLPQYANLAAAISVVHDQPLTRQINESRVRAPDPVELFPYFVEHERKMQFGLKNVPPELLVWVVDSTASVEEMEWAVERYAGDRSVGRRFFDIEYDHEHLETGREKRVTVEGLTLPNIRRYGGVCADQAYFAVSVGKAIGVPTAYTVGKSGSAAHAWVGYLQARRGSAHWNFDEGRYEAYQGVRGIVLDPQTRRKIPDSYVSLLAESIGTRESDRRAAVALTAAARRLGQAAASGQPFRPDPIAGDDATATPESGVEVGGDRQLSMLNAALQRNAGYRGAWFAVRDLATEGSLSPSQKRAWARKVQRFTGRQYPDFALAMLKPMIESIDDPKVQHQLWDAAFGLFARRSDLAAEVRLAQGELWERAGDPRRAGRCYQDVVRRYLDAGPFAVEALRRTETMLEESGVGERAIKLYASAWERLEPPDLGMYFRQSNWYKVGQRYAEHLEATGETAQAAEILDKLQRGGG